MILDEPAFASTLPPAKLRRVEVVAKAMCRHSDADEEFEDERDHCANCDTPEGGSCVAFGLYGGVALAVIEALDRESGK